MTTVQRSLSNSVGVCQAYCLNLGFYFSGLQYTDECWCSNNLPQLGLSSNCNMACNGIPSQICGGPNALSVYAYPHNILNTNTASSFSYKHNWKALGCYADKVNRTLPLKVLADDTMTVHVCLNACLHVNDSYAGLEYGRECWCGSELQKPDTSNDCNMPCLGNSTEICGGNWALSLYHLS